MKGQRRKSRGLYLTAYEKKQIRDVSGRPQIFRSLQYKISTVEGPWPVQGLQLKENGDIAIRPVSDSGTISWVIDHVPTGLSISRKVPLDLKRCVALAMALARFDWSGSDVRKCERLGPQVFAAMDELKIDYGRGIKLEPGDVVSIDLGKMKVGDSVKFRL